MKRTLLLILLLISTVMISSCSKDDGGETTATVTVSTTVERYGIVSGVNVSLVQVVGDAYVQEKVTNAEGKVTFSGILPGAYYIGCDYVLSSSDEHIGQSSEFQLTAGQTKSVSVALD